MRIRKLCKELNELCKELHSKYEINSGGCCYVASVIAKYLDKFGIKYRLVISDTYRKNYSNIQKELTKKRVNKDLEDSVCGDACCYHYYIHIMYAGEVNPMMKNITEFEFDNIDHSTISWIYSKGGWNSSYNVKNNSIINKLIKSVFKKYETGRMG